MSDTLTADFLTKVKKKIEPRGCWIREQYHEPKQMAHSVKHCYCLVGAMRAVEAGTYDPSENRDLEDNLPGIDILADLIRSVGQDDAEVDDGPADTVIRWNDRKSRTKGQVMALLDAAIERAKTAPAATIIA